MSTITTVIGDVTEPLKATEVDASSPASISAYVASQEAHNEDISDNFVPEVNEVGEQMNTVASEVNDNAAAAAQSVTDAETQVTLAEAAAAQSAASANNHGAWSNLTGAFPIGESVTHDGGVWISNIAISDVTASEPDSENSDWTDISIDDADLALKLDKQNPAVAIPALELNQANGLNQTDTMTGDKEYTDGLSDGDAVTFTLINGGYTPTYPTIEWWDGGDGTTEPTLGTKDKIVFWKEGSTLYGKHIGSIV